MLGVSQLAAEGSPHELASSRAAEGNRRPRPLTGTLIRATLGGWLLAVLVGTGCLLAGEKGSVVGIVTGPSRAPIPGANVTLAADDGSRQSVITDQGGRYSFPSVEPGTYTLSAEAAGYQAAARTAMRVTGGTSITVDLLLIATAPPGPDHAPPVSPQISYYDDTPLKSSGVQSTIEGAGYSSQAQGPRRLISEGPRLTGHTLKTPSRVPGSTNAAELERELQTALRAHPDSFEANHQLGEFHLSVGDFKTGIPYLEKARKLVPEDYANGYDLAVAYLETKDPGSARSLLQEMLRQKDTAELHNLLGEVDEALGDPTSAANECQIAAHMDPSEKNIFDWGNELLLHEALEPAIEIFKQGVALYPNSQRMYIDLGIAYYSRNLYDGAVEALCHASDLNPSDPRPYLFLGKLHNASAGKAGEVAKRLKRFMELNPDDALAYYYYALSSWKGSRGAGQGADLVEVEALLRKSITLDPRLADAHLQLGILFHDQQRDPEAIPEFQAAIRLRPDDPDAHYRLAQAYVRTGDKECGQAEFKLYDKLHKQ